MTKELPRKAEIPSVLVRGPSFLHTAVSSSWANMSDVVGSVLSCEENSEVWRSNLSLPPHSHGNLDEGWRFWLGRRTLTRERLGLLRKHHPAWGDPRWHRLLDGE